MWLQVRPSAFAGVLGGLAGTLAGFFYPIAPVPALPLRLTLAGIFGFGAASDTPLVMAEQGVFDNGKIEEYAFTTEHGPFGGLVMSKWQFSANSTGHFWPPQTG